MAVYGDKLAIESGGSDVAVLTPIGTVPGVAITLAAGLNRGEAGVLIYNGNGRLSWQAPGSSIRGAGVDVSAGGDFTLRDGADLDKWLQVTVTAAFLGGYQARLIGLNDVYNNAIGSTDRAIGAGTVTWTVDLVNNSGQTLTNITAWLHPDTPENRELGIRWGSAGSYVRPWSETEGATLFGEHDLADAAGETLEFQRVVGDVANPGRMVRGQVSFDDGDGGRARVEFRGRYRITTDAVYEAYQATGSDPVPGVDTPIDTSSTVPWSPPDTFGDATHRLMLCRVSRYGLRSTPTRAVRKRIVSGVAAELEPTEPVSVQVRRLPGGGTRVRAIYPRPVFGERNATEFCIWYTTDGSAPGSGSADFIETIKRGPGGLGILELDQIPAQADGVTVRVLVKTRRQGVVSPAGIEDSQVIRTVGPTMPAAGGIVPR